MVDFAGDHGRSQRLRDGREPHEASGVAVRRHTAFPIDDAGSRELDGPAVDLAKCLHAARY